MCRRILHDGVNHHPSLEPHLKSKLICVHYSFTFLFDNHLLVVPHVDTITTNKWLSSNLKGETEGILVAAQDQAIKTRNYQKVIRG